MATHYRACNLCEAMCGIAVESSGGRVTSIRPDPEDPFSRGFICPKATALKDLHEDPDRLKTPLLRTANGWQEISWDQALDEAATRIHAVQRRHGDDAMAGYLGNPNVHNTGALLFAPLFLRTLHTRHRYSATSLDQLPHHLAAYWMFGHQLMVPVPDVDRTQYFLVLGANPLASNGSMMTAGGMRRRLDALKERGGKLVVVDPRRTETAVRADEHLFITPGTDALFLLGLLHELLLTSPPRLGHLQPFTDGVAEVTALARRFPPERVSGPTGISAEKIRRIAKELAAAPAAICYGRIGTSTQPFGALSTWLITVVNAVTGNLDRAGGAMFTTPAIDPRTLPRLLGAAGRGSYGRWKSRVRGLPEAGGELPVSTLAEDILHSGPGQIKGLVVVAGNPVLSTPNGKRMEEALRTLELVVSVDIYLNETSRLAHLILPPPTPLERPHYDIALHMFQVRNTTRYAPALFDPGPSARHDWQILVGLCRRLEGLRGGGLRARLKWEATERFGPERMLDLAIRAGPHGGVFGLNLEKVKKHPHGLDLGPLEPQLPQKLHTKDRKLHLAPAPLLADVQRLEAAGEVSKGTDELLLINRRHLRDNNSWLHNVRKLVSGAPRCTLMIHPQDAASRGLSAGDLARVRSRVGEVAVTVDVTEDVMRGVVSLPHGYGHNRPDVKLTVASAHAGQSVNDLTDDQRVDLLSGNAAFSGVKVQVERA